MRARRGCFDRGRGAARFWLLGSPNGGAGETEADRSAVRSAWRPDWNGGRRLTQSAAWVHQYQSFQTHQGLGDAPARVKHLSRAGVKWK